MPNPKIKYLFLFTIGPVKSFLRESRKTQDIFAASGLLSHLCAIAIKKALQIFMEDEIEIITPDIASEIDFDKKHQKLSIPNRFMAKIESNKNSNQLIDIAKQIEQAVKDEFEKIPGFDITSLNIEAKKLIEAQLKAHLEISWLFHKIEGDTNKDYENAFMDINSNLAAIKNYTPFTKLPERGRKCIVDGRRNVKFYRETKDNEIFKFPNSEILKKLYQKDSEVKVLTPESKILPIWQLQKGEGISAVTLRKRLHENKAHEFPSTAAVALMHIFEECKDNEHFKKYKIAVQGEKNKIGTDFAKRPKWLDHSDDQLFFKDNIERILIKEEKCKKDQNKRCELEKEITDAHEAWSNDLKTPFTPYYALIRFDGDKMGDWFSGNYMKKNQDLKVFQKALSAAIIDFANTLQSEMNEYWGKVVYAGGEDFMAFVNLHRLKETVDCVRTLFNQKINENAALKKMVNDETVATLSMGICIAHYKEPLQMVLDKTAAAEILAKNNNRKSFAITISKHSGGQINMAHHWEENTIDIWENFNEILKAIIDKTTSAAFLRNIYDYLETYQFSEGTKEFLDSKIKLYVGRAKMPKVEPKKIETLIENLKSLHQGTVLNFAETLLVLDFLQRKTYEQ